MVRRIRALAAASETLLDGLLSMKPALRCDQDDFETGPLDVLVRNALRQESGRKADVPRVWSKLRNRVMGPFGTLAIEGPVFSATGSPHSQLSHHGRDLSAPVSDGSATPSALDEVCAVCMYRGADNHQMNLR